MSFFDDASLVLLTSGAARKDGKAYSMKPTDGSGDFTFTRGSNLSATLVDSNGLIEKGRENLLLQSNQFDTSPWINSGTTITSGQTGYDGSTDASLENVTATGTYKRTRQSFTQSGVYSFSVYAKANTQNFMYLYIDSNVGADPRVWFDLSQSDASNVIQTESFNISASVEDAGNGWYRCTIIALVEGTSNSAWIGISNADNTFNADASDSIYIQDAQLEVGLAATDYIESGASTGKAGLLENEPRFDYSGGATCPSLLLEPSRTNLVPQSEYFEGYGGFGVTLTTNYGTSPEGLQNSTRVVFDAGGDALFKLLSVGSGDETASIYVKGTSGETILFGKGASVASGNLYTLNGEWQRITYSGTNLGEYFHITTYNGATARDIEIWGAQTEAGSYPTSYIPNHSGGSVTRLADVCTNSTGGVSQTEGTIFIDYKDSPNKNVLFACSTSSGLITNNIRLSYNQLYIRNSTGNLVVGSVTLPDEGKLAIKYDTNGVKIFSNGNSTPIFTNSTRISFDGSVDFVRIGSRVNNAGIEEFNVDQFLIFTTALSDTQCVILTS